MTSDGSVDAAIGVGLSTIELPELPVRTAGAAAVGVSSMIKSLHDGITTAGYGPRSVGLEFSMIDVSDFPDTAAGVGVATDL